MEKSKKKWEKKSKKEKVDEKLRRKTKKSTLIRLGSLKVVFPGMGVVGCQFEPLVPPSYFKKNLSNIDITSYNWETIYLKYVKSEKNAHIICYKLTLLVCFVTRKNQKIQKVKKKKLTKMKIANIDRDVLHIF